MAALTTVSNIIDNLTLDKKWTSIQLGTNLHDAYLIAIKEESSDTTIINTKDIISVQLEIGIESGISNEYITIQRVSLNFKDFTSSDSTINEKTAFAALHNLPTNFYIRPISIQTATKQIEEGKTSLSINLNPLDLGDR